MSVAFDQAGRLTDRPQLVHARLELPQLGEPDRPIASGGLALGRVTRRRDELLVHPGCGCFAFLEQGLNGVAEPAVEDDLHVADAAEADEVEDARAERALEQLGRSERWNSSRARPSSGANAREIGRGWPVVDGSRVDMVAGGCGWVWEAEGRGATGAPTGVYARGRWTAQLRGRSRGQEAN